jgi:hypothetical protein
MRMADIDGGVIDPIAPESKEKRMVLWTVVFLLVFDSRLNTLRAVAGEMASQTKTQTQRYIETVLVARRNSTG